MLLLLKSFLSVLVLSTLLPCGSSGYETVHRVHRREVYPHAEPEAYFHWRKSIEPAAIQSPELHQRSIYGIDGNSRLRSQAQHSQSSSGHRSLYARNRPLHSSSNNINSASASLKGQHSFVENTYALKSAHPNPAFHSLTGQQLGEAPSDSHDAQQQSRVAVEKSLTETIAKLRIRPNKKLLPEDIHKTRLKWQAGGIIATDTTTTRARCLSLPELPPSQSSSSSGTRNQLRMEAKEELSTQHRQETSHQNDLTGEEVVRKAKYDKTTIKVNMGNAGAVLWRDPDGQPKHPSPNTATALASSWFCGCTAIVINCQEGAVIVHVVEQRPTSIKDSTGKITTPWYRIFGEDKIAADRLFNAQAIKLLTESLTIMADLFAGQVLDAVIVAPRTDALVKLGHTNGYYYPDQVIYLKDIIVPSMLDMFGVVGEIFERPYDAYQHDDSRFGMDANDIVLVNLEHNLGGTAVAKTYVGGKVVNALELS